MEKFTRDQETNVYRAKEVIRRYLNEKYLEIAQYMPNNWLYGSGFLTGGAIGSVLRFEDPKDWDIYFRNWKDVLVVKDTFSTGKPGLSIVKDADDDATVVGQAAPGKLGEAYLKKESGGGEIVVEGKVVTNNGILLTNHIQFITCQSGLVEEIHKEFDFKHCLPWYDIEKDKLHITADQYILCVDKILEKNIAKVHDYREKKFLDRGWKYNKQEVTVF